MTRQKTNKEQKISKILTGVSGEYFVAAELSERGLIASITLKNTRGIDILVSNSEATKTIGIQVKATQGDGRKWLLNKEAEDFYADNLFYVFVSLIGIGFLPKFYIVPSKTVSDAIKKGHKKWLATPDKHGQKRNDNSIRHFKDKMQTYLNKWDMLNL